MCGILFPAEYDNKAADEEDERQEAQYALSSMPRRESFVVRTGRRRLSVATGNQNNSSGTQKRRASIARLADRNAADSDQPSRGIVQPTSIIPISTGSTKGNPDWSESSPLHALQVAKSIRLRHVIDNSKRFSDEGILSYSEVSSTDTPDVVLFDIEDELNHDLFHTCCCVRGEVVMKLSRAASKTTLMPGAVILKFDRPSGCSSIQFCNYCFQNSIGFNYGHSFLGAAELKSFTH